MSDSTKAVFLSYAREDTAAAQRIAEALRSHGVEVWFDQNELRGGNAWDQKIRRQIGDCTIFLPIISQHTQERGKGYFRLEWKLAVEQTHLMAEGIAFLAPVAVDDTTESNAVVPPEFMRVQWTHLPGALPTPQFVEQIKSLLSTSITAGVTAPPMSMRQAPAIASAPAPAAKPSPRRFSGWAFAAVAVVVFGVVAVLLMKRDAGSAPPTAAVKSLQSKVAAGPSLAADEKSVAVLAFTDLSEAHNSEYFSDGISEDLLDALAKVPGLRVAARTSAFFFKGKNLPISEIAQKLNVAYVVEGSVQRAGDNIRITAQLIKATDGYHVWSEHFDRELKNVFAVQDEIAGLIAQNLELKLGASSAAATAAVNPQALELYLQARQAFNLRTAEGFARAEEALDRAIKLEPDFARAYALLANVWSVRDSSAGVISAFGQRQSAGIARIQAQIDRALALEPNLGEAHTAQGELCWIRWQLADAARELRLAIAQNPNDATAHQILGRVLLSDGRIEDAQAELKRAAELDPLSHRILDNYSIIERYTGRFEEALALDERALALQPDAMQAAVWKTLDLSGLGRHDEAVALLRRLPVDDTPYAAYAMEVFISAGLKGEAEQHLARVPSAFSYIALAKLGRPEAALAAVDPATLSIQSFHDLFLNPAFDPIRHDPRFVKLLATLGMTEAHARAQAWRSAHPLQKSK